MSAMPQPTGHERVDAGAVLCRFLGELAMALASAEAVAG